MNSIWSDFARMIYNVEVEVRAEDAAPDEALPQQRNGGGSSALNYSGGTLEDQPSAYGGEGYAVAADEPHEAGGTAVQQRRVDEHDQIGRNDPCWCGSGKKYKKCHGA
jgi:preprotein translocase subunit SecA